MAQDVEQTEVGTFSKSDQVNRGQRRRGKYFGKNSRLKDGNVDIKTLTLRDGEITFLLGANGGILGQIFTRLGDPDIDGAGVDTVMEFINITGDEFKMTGDVVPAVDDTYLLGYSPRAWQFVYSTNPFQNVSDARTKKDVKEIDRGLADILKIRPVSFVRIKDKAQRKQLGVIAQEIKEVLPEVVWGDESEILTVGYDAIVPVLVRAVQELSAKVDDLQAKLEKTEV